jgi:hypothetical protein
MITKQADTGNLRNHTHKLDELTSYPPRTLILGLDNYATSVLDITPLPNRINVDDYVVWINGVTYEDIYDGTNIEQLDLTATGLNGIVDGITFTAANSRDFLVWAFANNANNGFEGFAVTHKPYSAYTGPASASKGASVSFTGLTNAYQFTVGARVVVRNTVGTAPQYEWNWGTITAIVSSTSITVSMDNVSAYGVALTAATGGEILQWDKFRPWVVTSSAQTLYRNNYRLIGELDTNSSGDILGAYRVDDPYRPQRFWQVYSDTNVTITGGTGTAQSLGRYIPLWSKSADILLRGKATVINIVYHVYHKTLNTQGSGVQARTQVADVFIHQQSNIAIDTYATVYCGVDSTTNNNTDFKVFTYGYYVPGGMRE